VGWVAEMAGMDEVDKLNERIDDMKQEIANLKAEAQMMQTEKEEMETQLKSFARVNDALVNMLLETKQRAGEEAKQDSVELIRQRQALFNQNPHVTVDQLRAELRMLLSSKDGYERNLKKALAEKEKSWQLQIGVLEKQVSELTQYKENSEDQMAEVWKQVEAAQQTEASVVSESMQIVERLKADNRKMLETIKAQEEAAKQLHEQLVEKDRIIDEKDTELLQVSQLENQMHVLTVQNELAIKKTQAQAQAKLKDLDKQNEQLKKEGQHAAELREKVKEAQQEAMAYKNDIRRANMIDADKKVARFERVKEEQGQKLKKSQKQVMQLALLADKTTDANMKLEREYRKMFSAVKQQQKEILEQEQRAAREVDARKMAEQNPFYIDTYKRKLVQKEQEIESLRAKLRRMTVSENRGALLRKTMQAERGKYEAEIAALRAKVSDRPSTVHIRRPGSAASRSSKQADNGHLSALEAENARLKDRCKEFENMQTISETTNQAFQNLLKQHHELERSVLASRGSKSPALVPFNEMHRP